MNELALFAGAGGGILGGVLLGWKTVCAVEINPYAAGVLVARQNDGVLPPFPIWDDVRTFDGRPWRGIVDVISGGFPCQDISVAGKGAGIAGERSGLWSEFRRIIHEVRPRYAFVENSSALTIRGLGAVLGDLAEVGYDAEWCVLGADDVGAPHRRKRIWILADSDEARFQGRGYGKCIIPSGREESRRPISERGEILADTTNCGDVRRDGKLEPAQGEMRQHRGSSEDGGCEWWSTEPDVGRVAHGVAARVDRLAALGNGQVPLVAATAWNLLMSRIEKNGVVQ